MNPMEKMPEEKMPRSIIDENNEKTEYMMENFGNASRKIIGDKIDLLMERYHKGEIDEAGVAEGEKEIHDLVSEHINATMTSIKGVKKVQDSERGI
ncbi:MAG: hypothetical protein WC788_06730 [Candidatus Paceibacterota bacterium]|jgi:hypothetical protein